jgi:hypothetical protein
MGSEIWLGLDGLLCEIYLHSFRIYRFQVARWDKHPAPRQPAGSIDYGERCFETAVVNQKINDGSDAAVCCNNVFFD